MTTEVGIELHSDHLFSKWGFADGGLLDDWLKANGFGEPDYEDEVWYQFSRRLLCELVEKFLCSVIEQDIKPYRVATSHNPIRVYEVDGVRVDEAGSPFQLAPESVVVSQEDLLDLAQSLFNSRLGRDGKPLGYMTRTRGAGELARHKGWD